MSACHKALKQSVHQRGTFSSFSAAYIFSVKGVSNDTWITFRDAIAETGKYASRLDKLLRHPEKSWRSFDSLPGSVTAVTCNNSLPTIWISFFSIQLIDKTYMSRVQLPALVEF